MQEIKFYCRKCRKSLGLTYNAGGDINAEVMKNVSMKCHTCRRILIFKKYTEGLIIAGADESDRFYL